MKEIILKHGEICLVDNEDYERLNKYKWKCKQNKCGSYAYRTYSINNKPSISWMHKEVFGIVGKSKKRVDHKDFNGLNNQKYNLRICTHAQNNCYKRSAKNSTSKYLGVCLHKKTGKWRASIFKNYKQTHLGYHFTQEEAALAYNEAAKKYHGEFANLNIIV